MGLTLLLQFLALLTCSQPGRDWRDGLGPRIFLWPSRSYGFVRASTRQPPAPDLQQGRTCWCCEVSKFKEERNGWMAPANFFLGAANGIPSLPPTDAPACACAASHCISLKILAAIPREAQIWPSVCDHSALQDLQGLWPGLHEDVALDEGSSHWGWLWLGFWREHSPAALICRWQPCYAKCRKCRSLGIRGSSCRGGETCGRKNQWSPSRNGCFPESSLICWGAEICLHQKCGEAKWCSKCQGHMMAIDGLEGPIPRDSIGVRWSAERSLLCCEKVGPGLTEAQANAALEAMAFPSPRRRRLRPRCYTQQWIGSNGRSSGMPIAGLVVCSKISGWSPKTTRRRSWSAPSKLPWRGGRSRRKRRRRKGRPWSLRRSLERSSESECCKMPQIRYCTDHLNRGKSFALLGIHFPFVCGLKVEVNHVQLLICWRPRQIQRLILPHTMVHSL